MKTPEHTKRTQASRAGKMGPKASKHGRKKPIGFDDDEDFDLEDLDGFDDFDDLDLDEEDDY